MGLTKISLLIQIIQNRLVSDFYTLFGNKVVLKPVLLLKSNLALRLFTWRLRQALKRS
jgi:hypothetical protein